MTKIRSQAKPHSKAVSKKHAKEEAKATTVLAAIENQATMLKTPKLSTKGKAQAQSSAANSKRASKAKKQSGIIEPAQADVALPLKRPRKATAPKPPKDTALNALSSSPEKRPRYACPSPAPTKRAKLARSMLQTSKLGLEFVDKSPNSIPVPSHKARKANSSKRRN